ncbi:hypothetical protein NDU88_002736, partial [Pleurodeles waltl]
TLGQGVELRPRNTEDEPRRRVWANEDCPSRWTSGLVTGSMSQIMVPEDDMLVDEPMDNNGFSLSLNGTDDTVARPLLELTICKLIEATRIRMGGGGGLMVLRVGHARNCCGREGLIW